MYNLRFESLQLGVRPKLHDGDCGRGHQGLRLMMPDCCLARRNDWQWIQAVAAFS